MDRCLATDCGADCFAVADHELLIVNNDPADRAPAEIVAEARRTSFAPRPDRLRLVQSRKFGYDEDMCRNCGADE